MKIKTNELTGTALDWAVAKCDGISLNEGNTLSNDCDVYSPSTDWAQGGPIIEGKGIQLARVGSVGDVWEAWIDADGVFCQASTLLIAAMRCFVASELGDEVDVPVMVDDETDESEKE